MNKSRFIAVLLSVCFLLTLCFSIFQFAKSTEAGIPEWRMQWILEADSENRTPPSEGEWHFSSTSQPLLDLPKGAVGAWIHFVAPPTSDWMRPGLLIDRLYGLDMMVYEEKRLAYQTRRGFDFERNHLLMPLTERSESANIYIRIESKERAGISSKIEMGEFDILSDHYVRMQFPDVFLGVSIAFLALVMLLCSGYLNSRQRGPWISLSLIALTLSILTLTYSTFAYDYFGEFGSVLLLLFDTSMYVLFPALHFYVASIFEGRYPFFTQMGRWLIAYSALCFAITIAYKIFGAPLYPYYRLFTFWILAPLIFAQLLTTFILSFLSAFKGYRNSIILLTGILALALSGVADLILLYAMERAYVLFLWKFGVLFLIAAFIAILARRISTDYAKLLNYSRELELFNHRLQRTEKMKIISDLAASVAHEVRNPMQVARGFLQLLSKKSSAETQPHFTMAIQELDRASEIITDFLTFAKPELDNLVPMNLRHELTKIETMMRPLAAMHGGILIVQVPENLHILGNPSKFKQALINMIKNSIESLQEDGIVEIIAYAEQQSAIIRISDNGEGMDEEQITKLGEPFFSTKTKGTGLGLMVTYRIIEAMKGSLEFRSIKGKGTDANVRFPLTIPN